MSNIIVIKLARIPRKVKGKVKSVQMGFSYDSMNASATIEERAAGFLNLAAL
jgi:hypothetical protein